MISTKEQIARFQLLKATGIGPMAFRYILKTFGSAVTAMEKLPNMMRQKEKWVLSSPAVSEHILKQVEFHNQEMVWLDEAMYPKQLQSIESAPPVLFYRGTLKQIKNIGIVGTRNASLPALSLTEKLSSESVQKGYGVISGLAYGIDTAAHTGALKGKGYTIGVLAGSVENIYPLRNTKLYNNILESGGAIISEHPPETQPAAPLFPSRNRIIAGLSDLTLVIEAKRKSGSLITADYAKKYGRPVGAVPGFPTDERAGGPNHLLKNEGALYIESIDDLEKALLKKRNHTEILFEINEIAEDFIGKDIAEENLLSLLSKTPVAINQLVDHLKTSKKSILGMLLILELERKVKLLPAGFVIKL
ncbi:MAG: DNA-processing protein DprA [Alphaproteobacteria bacterium]|nr:DNA-processing protein DprA [Alphaproteobacteria bacterium]